MSKKLTIYDIKYLATNAGHYFDRKTLQFFGQTLKDFSVKKCDDGRYFFSAPIRIGRGGPLAIVGGVIQHSEMFFDPTTNRIERK